MTTLREAVQQALELLYRAREHFSVYTEGDWFQLERDCQSAITALRAALAQQDEPDHETRAELAEQQVVQLAEERDHYRNLWQKAQEQAKPLNLSDPAVRKRLASQWGYVPAAAQAEPVEPVAWECKAGGLKPLTQRQYDAQTVATKRHYTRIAPPQRTMVLLTAQELDGVIERHVGGSEITDDMYTSMEQFARAVEKASWEKNHG